MCKWNIYKVGSILTLSWLSIFWHGVMLCHYANVDLSQWLNNKYFDIDSNKSNAKDVASLSPDCHFSSKCVCKETSIARLWSLCRLYVSWSQTDLFFLAMLSVKNLWIPGYPTMYEVAAQTDPEGAVYLHNVTTAGAQDANLTVINLNLPRVSKIFKDVSFYFHFNKSRSFSCP